MHQRVLREAFVQNGRGGVLCRGDKDCIDALQLRNAKIQFEGGDPDLDVWIRKSCGQPDKQACLRPECSHSHARSWRDTKCTPHHYMSASAITRPMDQSWRSHGKSTQHGRIDIACARVKRELNVYAELKGLSPLNDSCKVRKCRAAHAPMARAPALTVSRPL